MGAVLAGMATLVVQRADLTAPASDNLGISALDDRRDTAEPIQPPSRTPRSDPPSAPPAPATPAEPAPTTTPKPKPTSSSAAPTTTRAAPPPPPATPARSQVDQVIALVNQERAARSCGPVSSDDRLERAAVGHSTDMSDRDYFSHTTPEGVDFAQRIRDAGYPRPGAENIARGQRSAQEVMADWMNSDGHRRNILNCELTAIGVGLDPDGWYWTQDFGY